MVRHPLNELFYNQAQNEKGQINLTLFQFKMEHTLLAHHIY